MHELHAADGNHGSPPGAGMNRRTVRNLPLAVCLVAGVLLFAFGASRLVGSTVQVAERISKRSAVQIVTVDP